VKPVAFSYERPESVDEAVALLREHGDEAKVLAGGQSLVPMLNFRLASPSLLVDLNGIDELSYLHEDDGSLRIGALTRQATVERSQEVKRRWPLLNQTLRVVGHAAIRNRGTIGGSVAHADPAAELPVALVTLDARFVLRSAARGERIVAAADMFLGPLTTALAADELLTEVAIPPLPRRARTVFVEHARTHGDFALAGVAVVLAPGEHAAIGLLGAGAIPVRASEAEQALLDGARSGHVAALAAAEVKDDYRRALITELVRQALE